MSNFSVITNITGNISDIALYLECMQGYKYFSGHESIVCHNGAWDRKPLICEGKYTNANNVFPESE